MTGIYKITNPIGEIYIGQTIDYNKRLKNYKNLHCKKQQKIYNSLINHGVKNHIFEFIEECEIKELNNRERHYQDVYETLKKGLNLKLTNSEDKSGFLSKEVKEKISNSMIGNKHSEETKIRMSKARKELNLKGIKYKTKKDEIKTIYQYDLNNNLIKEWDSFRDIIDSYPKGIRTIWKCLRKEQKISLNYIWSYNKL